MASVVHSLLLIVTLILSVYADEYRFDHIFVFEGEPLTIDCTGGKQSTILKYRKLASDPDPIVYFYHKDRRDDAALGIEPRTESEDSHNIWYEIEKAEKKHGGEYECDWSKENDELNHYVNIVDKDTLSCPEFPALVEPGALIPNLTCSISKSGTIVHDWLVNKIEHLNLDFTIVDSAGNPVAVEYDETFDSITAKVVDLKLSKEQNGTTLTCKFASMSKNVSECKSNAALVQWSPSGLSVDAPDMAEIDKAFAAKCDLDDAGNPEAATLLKINDVASTDTEIIATLEQVPVLNISCHAGDLVARKAVLLHLGPESVKAAPEEIEAKEGDSMVFACELPEKLYPGAEITYKIDGKVVATNLTAKAEHNGKKIFCTAKNTLSMKEATANISMNVQFKPSTSRASVPITEELDTELVLDCDVSANPEPTYTWSFTPKDASANDTKDLSETGAQYRIEKLSAEEVGSYVCKATNEHGSAVVQIDLSQKEANAAVKTVFSSYLIMIVAWGMWSILLLV
jgi:hypothetical protein